MKTKEDPRHKLRRRVVKALFAETFTHQRELPKLAQQVLKQKSKLDKMIKKAAPAWPVDKLNRIDLAILRLAVYELNNKKTPPKVIIDEAVELAKEYGSEASPSFVNGVLGALYGTEEKKEKS
jgi:N utilization substance protein B